MQLYFFVLIVADKLEEGGVLIGSCFMFLI